LANAHAPFRDYGSPKGGRKRVIMIAYALSPVLGSEYRSAWELANLISRDHDLTVLFGDSDGLMGSFQYFDTHAANNHLPFRAIKVEPSAWQVVLARKMRRMPWGLFFFGLLKTWQKKAFAVALELHVSEPFDVAHQLGPIGFRNPGYLWGLDCHTYWGPIGGAQNVDTRMIKSKWSSYYLEALLRNTSVRFQAIAPYTARAARGYDRVSFATVENAEYFRKHFGREGPVISDQGLIDLVEIPEPVPQKSMIRVAWAGSLTPRKNVDALLDVIRAAPPGIQFNVMGGGSREAEVRALAAERPNLHFKGMLPRSEVIQVLRESNVVLLTSLSEGNPAILLEGIENDCIPIAPRINGFVSTLNEKVAFLIDQGDYHVAVAQTVRALKELSNGENLSQMKLRLRRHRPSLSWQSLAQAHVDQYD
jgi:glycosyltransferase involved in cell wall biosynthesis